MLFTIHSFLCCCVLLHVAALIPVRAFGQNLVPNPSFEDTIACPISSGQVQRAVGWSNYSNQSPDYFNSCTTNAEIDVPNNGFGFQEAHSGTAYCGLSTFFQNTPDNREIIGRSLSDILEIGTKYFVSFSINLSIDPEASTSYASNNLGVRFSTLAYSELNPSPINNFAHLRTETIVTDTANWTSVFGSFIADSAYSFIELGNFYDDQNTDTQQILDDEPFFDWAYYFIDDICVSIDSVYASNYVYTNLTEHKEEFILYPNPAESQFWLRSEPQGLYDLSVFDACGNLLIRKKDINKSHLNVEISNFRSGVLIVNIKTSNTCSTHRLLKL